MSRTWWDHPWRLLGAGALVFAVGLSAQLAAHHQRDAAADDLAEVQDEQAAVEDSLAALDDGAEDLELQLHLANSERGSVLGTAENVLGAAAERAGVEERRLATAQRMADAVRADDGAGFNAAADAQGGLADDATFADGWFRDAAGVLAADLDRLRYAIEDLLATVEA